MLMEREWAKGSRFLPEQWQEPLLSVGLEDTGLPGTPHWRCYFVPST